MALNPARAASCFGAATLLLSCGLMSPSESGAPGTRDTAVGFEDGPGIEVCFGEVPVVSPSRAKSGALSICVPGSEQAKSCTDRRSCNDGERCVCGRCVTRPCRNATDCEAQEVCQNNRCARGCTKTSDCSAGEACSSGGCARSCGGNGVCPWGETCSVFDGRCVVKLCGNGVSCASDEACVEQQRIADLREPDIVNVGGDTIAYLEVRGSDGDTGRCAVHRARVESARRWRMDPIDPVLAPRPDEDCIGAPSVVVIDGNVVMFAQRGDGEGIVRASSKDGRSFAREQASVLEPEAAWEQGWVGAPGAAVFDGGVVLAYEAARGAALGMARVTADGVNRVSMQAPALRPNRFEDPVLWRQIERIGSPFLLERDGALLVYLTVRGVEGSDAQPAGAPPYPADRNDSIGLASTTDLTTWTAFPSGPVFARRTNLRAYLGEREPCVLATDEGAWLAYVGADASGEFVTGLGLAVAKR